MDNGTNTQASVDNADHTMEVPQCPDCNHKMTIQFDRFKDTKYTNWIQASLCLQLTKEGLEDFVETSSADLHFDLKDYISAAVKCTGNSSEDLKSHVKKTKCQNCKNLKEKIECECNNKTPTWKNASLKEMMDSPNNVAKLFMPPKCRDYSNPEEGDITALLSFIANNKSSRSKIKKPEIIDEVRNCRNDVMHSGNLRIENKELNDIKDTCVRLLTAEGHLKDDENCQNATCSIQQKIGNRINIDLIEAEKKAIHTQNKDFEDELSHLNSEISSPESTPEKNEMVKQEAKKILEHQIKVKASFECLKMDTNQVRKLTDMARDTCKHAEEKTIESIVNEKTKADSEDINILQDKVRSQEEDLKLKRKEKEKMKQKLQNHVDRNNKQEEDVEHARKKIEENTGKIKWLVKAFDPSSNKEDILQNPTSSVSQYDLEKQDELATDETDVVLIKFVSLQERAEENNKVLKNNVNEDKQGETILTEKQDTSTASHTDMKDSTRQCNLL